jgi:lysophospholipase L1-like esterase
VNRRLKQIADAEGAEFFDWASSLNGGNLFYRDGFHPNDAGAVTLARLLREKVQSSSFSLLADSPRPQPRG